MIRALRATRIGGWAAAAAVLVGVVLLVAAAREGATQAPAADAPVIAVLDTNRLLREDDQWIDAVEERNRKVESRTRTLNKLVRQLQVLRNEHDSLPPGSEERQSKAVEVNQAFAELENKRREYEAEAAQMYNDAVRGVLDRVTRATRSYAEEHGVDIVLRSQDLALAARETNNPQMLLSTADVIYAGPRMDITGAVVERMNAEYRGPVEVQ